MADFKLPWFRFDPAKHLAGNIQYCSLSAQGLYGNIKAFYWQRECEMSKADLYRKYKEHHPLLDELIREAVIKIEDDMVLIEFLMDDWDELYVAKKHSSDSGKKGQKVLKAKRAAAKALTPQQGSLKLDAEVKTEAPAPPAGKFFKIGMKTHLALLSAYCKQNIGIHMEEVIMKVNQGVAPDKKISIDRVLNEMDAFYANGYEFSGNNHLRNTFKMVANQIRDGRSGLNNNTATVATKGSAPNIDK